MTVPLKLYQIEKTPLVSTSIEEELLKVARSSDNKKEAQNGFIPARLLQRTEKDYLRYLLAIISHCISNNTFPSKLKLGENIIKFE